MLSLCTEEYYFGLKNICTDADKLTLKDGKIRSFDNSYTLRKVWPLRQAIGITRITDLTELDYIGIPVISAIRPAVDTDQITATQGKGLKKNEALVSALMEAVERFSCAHYKSIYQVSFNIDNPQFVLANIAYPHQWEGQVLEWIESVSLKNGSKKYLLAADVLFPYHTPKGINRPVRPSTTGISSGNTLAEALLSGVFEVIERDASTKFLIEEGNVSFLDLNSVKSPSERALLDLFKDAKIDIQVFDLSALSTISVYYASILNSEGIGPDIACAGQGAHLLPEIALRRALTEAAQSRIVALQGSREDLIRHDSDWTGAYNYFKEKREQRKLKALKTGGIKSMPKHSPSINSFQDLMYKTLNKLAYAGYEEIYYTDLTHKNIGIPVVHVCIPGMIDGVIDPQRARIR